MDQRKWIDCVPSLGWDPERAGRCIVVEPGLSPRELAQAEAKLEHALPQIVTVVLEQWRTQRAEVLLHTIPHLLNPTLPGDLLNPAGESMESLFPAWCEVLHSTEQCAVILDVARPTEVLLVGRAQQEPPVGSRWPAAGEGLRPWAYYLPKPLSELADLEARAEHTLTPQMRQFYTRVWGAADMYVCPYLARLDELEPGFLYEEFYRALEDQMPLAPETTRQLQRFVVLYGTPTGDFIGYFAGKTSSPEEPPIYLWDHETVQFELWAPDFARAVDKLVREDV